MPISMTPYEPQGKLRAGRGEQGWGWGRTLQPRGRARDRMGLEVGDPACPHNRAERPDGG